MRAFGTTTRALLLAGLAWAGACAPAHDDLVFDRLDCNSCHAPAYDMSIFHAGRDDSRECYRCHGTTDWRQAFANHDSSFPIGTGSHRGYDCADCHIAFTRNCVDDITCIDCHEHREDRVRPFHRGNSGFTYASCSCWNCHPRGGGD